MNDIKEKENSLHDDTVLFSFTIRREGLIAYLFSILTFIINALCNPLSSLHEQGFEL